MKVTVFRFARGVLVTLGAAVLGALLGGLVWAQELLDGLYFIPFTLVGAGAVLLPAYLWARHGKDLSKFVTYVLVLLAGLVGSSVLLALISLLFGGVTAQAPPVSMFSVAAVFGTGTAIFWLALHHLTEAKPRA